MTGKDAFELVAQPRALTVTAGSTAAATIRITGTDPAGVHVSVLSTHPLVSVRIGAMDAQGKAPMSIGTSRRTPPGLYRLTVVGTGGAASGHSDAVTLRVVGTRDLAGLVTGLLRWLAPGPRTRPMPLIVPSRTPGSRPKSPTA
ncbi:hypothetical protein ACFWBN_13190 [Streptomyces sp. NPDC059989]|uniref:hypothetical protein n=1 Tax=Streptomyces sp. NPDC059989 TaxID=3347026 RepID=UPI0036C19CBF